MGAVSNMFNAVIAWLKDDIKQWKRYSLSGNLSIEADGDRPERVEYVLNNIDFEGFNAIFEMKDGAYHVGNHRLSEHFGEDAVRALWHSKTDAVLTFSDITLNIYLLDKKTFRIIALVNTRVPEGLAAETQANLRDQLAIKLKELWQREVAADD